ncbi:hypothetical protein TPSD3_13400 [Thioflexithrix psekupsensis]|uniref:DUF4390 domain-containing protein n=2 Tax=Thioflexithrix psekupsensis TaxID=1570016 RepID=A0A251X4U2_9GAMM|nr:hypothetical protein TPSD3_13400 [Thioflexithrix psekupsensis]
MVFIMPVWLKQFSRLTLATGLLLLLSYSDGWAEFSIHYANTRLSDKVYLLDAQLNYHLTDAPKEALHNGVALTLVLTILVQRERWYFLNETVATLRQQYQLGYNSLAEQYSVTYLNTGIEETFPTLEAALLKLGTLKNFPLLDSHLIAPDQTYWVHLQSRLDIEALPAPLRPVAYFSAQWRLVSDWYLCPLQAPSSPADSADGKVG